MNVGECRGRWSTANCLLISGDTISDSGARRCHYARLFGWMIYNNPWHTVLHLVSESSITQIRHLRFGGAGIPHCCRLVKMCVNQLYKDEKRHICRHRHISKLRPSVSDQITTYTWSKLSSHSSSLTMSDGIHLNIKETRGITKTSNKAELRSQTKSI